MGRLLVLAGGAGAILVGLALFVWVVVGVGLNWLNMYTILLTILAGVLGVAGLNRLWLQWLAIILLIAGVSPALASIAYFYLLPLLLMLAGVLLQTIQYMFKKPV